MNVCFKIAASISLALLMIVYFAVPYIGLYLYYVGHEYNDEIFRRVAIILFIVDVLSTITIYAGLIDYIC